ncbi:hypothetical protein PE36_19925 [Moritella sp. PE36]|nr:hypothetical protein PE36_19925 [Moritella sp. PE36]
MAVLTRKNDHLFIVIGIDQWQLNWKEQLDGILDKKKPGC